MNKILTIGCAIIIATTLTHNAYSLNLMCEIKEQAYNCAATPEESTLDPTTCNDICSTCSGNIILPSGYISSTGGTTVTKIPSIECPTLSGIKYTQKCSCTIAQTVSCDTANGYSGTATFNGTNFFGCISDGGGIIIDKMCKQGEYMAGTTCTPCPSFNGVAGTTEFIGKNPITACYIPSGNTFTDDTGTYTLTDNCFYTE